MKFFPLFPGVFKNLPLSISVIDVTMSFLNCSSFSLSIGFTVYKITQRRYTAAISHEESVSHIERVLFLNVLFSNSHHCVMDRNGDNFPPKMSWYHLKSKEAFLIPRVSQNPTLTFTLTSNEHHLIKFPSSYFWNRLIDLLVYGHFYSIHLIPL